MIETINRLTTVIRMESEIIDELFSLLLQHISTEDEGVQKIINMIAEVSEIDVEV